jgi:hypothetical protein
MITTEIAPVVKQQITKAIAAAQALEIKVYEDLPKAIDLLSKIKKVGKIIKDEKEKITKPFNEGLKNARAFFAQFEAQNEEAEKIVKDKMLDYNRKVEQERIKEEAKIAAKVESGKMSLEKAAEKMELVKEAPKSVEGNVGKISIKKIKKFEVVDKTKLPFDFLQPDMVKIREAMFANQILDGVRYWEEEQINSR